MQTRRLQESFEGSYSSLAYSSGELSRATVAASGRLMHFLILGVKWGFWAITLVPDMLEGQAKGSIDVGDYLVSEKSFSQNFGPLDWRPGPVKVGQKTKTPPLCVPVPGEPLTQIKIFFFNRTKKTCCIRRGFEQLSSYSGWRVITKKARANLLARAVVKEFTLQAAMLL